MGILQCTDERQASPIFGLVSVIQSLLGTFCNARTSTNQPISGLCHCPPKAFQPGSILQCIHKHQPTPFLVASNSSSSVTFRMDAKAAQSMQFMSTTWVNSEKLTLKPSVSLSFAVGSKQQWRLRVTRTNRDGHGSASLAASCSSSSNNFPASTLESKSFSGFLNEDLILKSKSQDIGPCLNGRCVYLVGMMGSGKTTIGKILSQALDHSFFDSDTLVEKALNGTSVAEIFKLYGEGFFREKETDVLRKLSLMHQLVVSTGGGAVMRPINWKYMQKGVSVWLDVPLEALAQRIAAVGIDSRPLLHHDAGDAYMKAFKRLSTLFEERGEAYAQANARVSLENIAAKIGHSDVFSITPAQIAIEALEQIGNFLNEEQGVL